MNVLTELQSGTSSNKYILIEVPKTEKTNSVIYSYYLTVTST